jgi:hypothetical protein
VTRPPTIAQLRNLADRAEHGLTPDETARLREGIARLAEYEHTINWHTTCTGCARILDSCIRETERAEKAETALACIAAIAEEYPAGIDTALILEALPDAAKPRHDDGPTIAECRVADRRWPLQRNGE